MTAQVLSLQLSLQLSLLALLRGAFPLDGFPLAHVDCSGTQFFFFSRCLALSVFLGFYLAHVVRSGTQFTCFTSTLCECSTYFCTSSKDKTSKCHKMYCQTMSLSPICRIMMHVHMHDMNMYMYRDARRCAPSISTRMLYLLLRFCCFTALLQ